MYSVYILECADGTLYVGTSNHLGRRIHAHNHLKSGAKYTRSRRPVALKYHEQLTTRGEALRRESEIKRLKRGQKLDLILREIQTPLQ